MKNHYEYSLDPIDINVNKNLKNRNMESILIISY